MAEVEIRVPDLGTTVDQVQIVKWLVEVGQPVKTGQPLLEVETDKAVTELESVAAGTLKKIRAHPGEQVTTGQVIAIVDGTSATGAASPQRPPAQQAAPTAEPAAGAEPSRNLGAMFKRKPPAEQSLPASQPRRPQDYDRSLLLSLYERMFLIRTFEERIKLLFLEGSMPGTVHQCQGQEACAVGVCAALEADDFITSTFRGHGHALAKGLSVEEMFFELFGATTGCCRGKGGSMHMGNMQKGMVPGIAIVGGGVPLAAGMALAFKMQKRPQVVACFFGDGAIAEGAFHEGINLAAIWDLPVIYVCENNLYGASTRVDKVMRTEHIADRAAGYGIRGETIDGNDVLAVLEAATVAAAECRAGNGPVLLELLTYRRTGHSRRDPGHYQARQERDAWMARDPIELFGRQLLQRDDVSDADLDEIGSSVSDQFEAALKAVQNQPQPNPDELNTDVFA